MADSLAALCMPEDLVNCFPFLVPDEEAFVNGATLMVEGGASADMPACCSLMATDEADTALRTPTADAERPTATRCKHRPLGARRSEIGVE